MNRYNIKNRIKFYEKNKKIIESNDFNYVPFYGFNNLQKYIPGIVPGIMYKITSHMGVGKTQISKFLFVYQTMLYALKNNIDFKVIYFALEESKEQFLDGLFLHILRRVHKVQLNIFSLTGVSKVPLTASEMKALKDSEELVARLSNNIEIIDNKYKPTELYNTCKIFAKKWGVFLKNKEGEDIDTSYKAHNSKQIVLVVTDHISLLEPEYDEKTKQYFNERRTISKWHTDYCRRIITKFWNWSVLNIQQQSLDSEKQQFTNRGDTIINKILPSLDGLANNKEVGRDDMVILGVFAPNRYGLDDYMGYKIENHFGDRFRSLHLLKNRFGMPNKILPLYFDGRYTYFKEMPYPTDPGMKYFETLLTK